MRAQYPAELAVYSSGLSEAEVCRRARVGVRYLRRIYRTGAPYGTAERLARVTGAPITAFQRPPHRGRETPAREGWLAQGDRALPARPPEG